MSLFYAFILARAFALETTVKTRANFCGGGAETELVGSGWVTEREGRYLVVTSEHVLYHDPTFCFAIKFTGEDEWRVARLKLVDAGMGLGLLEADGGGPRARSFALAAAAPERDLAAVTTTGFPARARDLVLDRNGRVLTYRSDRHLIPLLDKTYEVVGSHGEFGMSGGPVLNGDELVGLLSHQYIRQNSGQSALVETLGAETVNHLVVIPGETVLTWTHAALGNPQFRASLLTPITREDALLSAGVRWSASPTDYRPARQRTATLSGDGAGIGGTVVDGEPIAVTLSLAGSPSETEWFLPARQDWLEKQRAQLERKAEIRIPFLIERDARNQRLTRIAIYSLADFFQKLRNPQVQPAVAISGPLHGSYDKRSRLLAASATRVASELAALREGATPATLLFLRRIDDLREMARTDGWLTLTEADFQNLRMDGPHAGAWRELTVKWDHMVALLAELNTMGCLATYACRNEVLNR